MIDKDIIIFSLVALIISPLVLFGLYLNYQTRKNEKKKYQFLIDKLNAKELTFPQSGCSIKHGSFEFILDFVAQGSGAGSRQYLRLRNSNIEKQSFCIILAGTEKYFFFNNPDGDFTEFNLDQLVVKLYCKNEIFRNQLVSKIRNGSLNWGEVFANKGTSIEADYKYISLNYFIGTEAISEDKIKLLIEEMKQFLKILNK